MYRSSLVFMILVNCFFVYGMNESLNASHDIRSLPVDVRNIILASKDFGFLEDAINFLGLQPITLENVYHPQLMEIHDNELYMYVRNNHFPSEKYSGTWNICTGECLKSLGWEQYPAGNAFWAIAKSGNKVATIECGCSHISIGDKKTNQILNTIDVGRRVWSVTMNDNVIAIGLDNGLVRLWYYNVHENFNSESWVDLPFPTHSPIYSVAIKDDHTFVGGAGNGIVYLVDKNRKSIPSKQVLAQLIMYYCARFTKIVTHNTMLLAGTDVGMCVLWDMNTGKELRKFDGLNGHSKSITSLALNNDVAITGSEDCTVKIWPLKINLKGKPEDNGLVWLVEKADILQLDFVRRACKAAKRKKEFVIDMPEKLGEIKADESNEQWDGRIYFSLPDHVREYLCKRVRIRRLAQNFFEKTYVETKDNCRLM